jgi:hypothetical protein
MLLITEENIRRFKEDLLKDLENSGRQTEFEENRRRGQSSLGESELKELECLDENEKELKALGYYRRLEQEQKKIMSIWLLIINRVTSLTVFLSKVGLLMIFLLGVSLIERMSIVAVFALASYLIVAFLRIPFFFDLIFGNIIWAQPVRALLRRYKNFGMIEAKIDVTDPRGLHSFGKDKLIFDPSYIKSRI